MIEEILEVYRYMPADEKIKGEKLSSSHEFPYLYYKGKIGHHNVFICMNVYDKCYNLLGTIGMNRYGVLVTDCSIYLNENKIISIFIRYLVKYLIEVRTSYRVMFECINMENKFVFDGYEENVLAIFDINHKLLFKGNYEDCFKKFIKKEGK